MTYITNDESDAILAHNADWVALSDVVKSAHLVTAALWMNYTYVWPGIVVNCDIDLDADVDSGALPYTLPFLLYPGQSIDSLIRLEWPRQTEAGGFVEDCQGCPIYGVPQAVRQSQAIAAETNLTVPLFAAPASSATADGITRKKIKVGSIEIETEWSEAKRGAGGQIQIQRVDAMLGCIVASKRGEAYVGPSLMVV